MKYKWFLFSLILISFSITAAAADFGAHIGYYDNDVKKAYIGANIEFPLGPVAIMPNVDYWREHGVGYWLGGGDVVFRGPSFWVGAGPTYGYVTNYDASGYSSSTGHALQYTPGPTPGNPGSQASIAGPFGNGKDNAWGWDVNGGFSFGTMGHGLRPYITGRYNKVKDLKAGGVAVGLRFGM